MLVYDNPHLLIYTGLIFATYVTSGPVLGKLQQKLSLQYIVEVGYKCGRHTIFNHDFTRHKTGFGKGGL